MVLSLLQLLGPYLKADVFSDVFSPPPRPCGNHSEELTMYRETETKQLLEKAVSKPPFLLPCSKLNVRGPLQPQGR